MITEFKDSQVRQSGVIYDGTWEQIKLLYETDKEMGGELAISAIELCLTGEISSNNPMIAIILKNYEKVNKKDSEKWEKRVEDKRQKRIGELQLEEIAAMLESGVTQQVIADTLGLSKQTISYRVKILRNEFPELCNEKSKSQKSQKPVTVTDTETVTDTVTETITLTETKSQKSQKGKKESNLTYLDFDREAYEFEKQCYLEQGYTAAEADKKARQAALGY